MKYFSVFALFLLLALMMSVNAQSQTECPSYSNDGNSCICTDEVDPVCSTDGRNFSNDCRRQCAGATLDHKGCCELKQNDKKE